MGKIAIIGATYIGSTIAKHLAESGNVCALMDAVDNQFAKPKENEVFRITRLPDLPEIWIDPNEPVFNYKKHKQTCINNRRKRKKRRK